MLHPTLPEYFVSTLGEGGTSLYDDDRVSEFADMKTLHLKHEGRNPTGSFKDRGMAVAVSEAKRLGMLHTICVSSGDTSASAAAYSSNSELTCIALSPEGKADRLKLAQAEAYGAKVEYIHGTFTDSMNRMIDKVKGNGKYYPLNSTNPWIIEGQKTIIFEMIESLLRIDFIAVPAGSLDNICAFGKAIREMKELGVLYDIPRIIAVRSSGARMPSKYSSSKSHSDEQHEEKQPRALDFHNFLNWKKAERELEYTDALPVSVTNTEIGNAKRVLDSSGIGCDFNSALSLAGVTRLRMEGTLDKSDEVSCILTGHILNDMRGLMERSHQDHDEEVFD